MPGFGTHMEPLATRIRERAMARKTTASEIGGQRKPCPGPTDGFVYAIFELRKAHRKTLRYLPAT